MLGCFPKDEILENEILEIKRGLELNDKQFVEVQDVLLTEVYMELLATRELLNKRQKCLKIDDNWEDVKVPGFDDMVTPDQLYKLCVAIGNAIFKQIPILIIFAGPGPSGKTTVCHIIKRIAKSKGIKTCRANYIENDAKIVFKLEDDGKELPKIKFPLFCCTNKVLEGKNVIKFHLKNKVISNFLETIDLSLVELKCWKALNHEKKNFYSTF